MKTFKTFSILLVLTLLVGCSAPAVPSVPESAPAVSSISESAPASDVENTTPASVQLSPGPWQNLERISVTAGPFYAQPAEDSSVLLDLPEHMSNGLVCLEEKDGWSHCVIGVEEGWLPSDRVLSKLVQTEPSPDFLPQELQLLYAKALSLYNAYYPGAQSSGIGFCDRSKSLEGERNFYCADCVYPTMIEWKQALSAVFSAQLTEDITDPQAQERWPVWLEENGRLYFAQGDRGTHCPQLNFVLREADENHILFDACAEFIDNQPWQVSQPIELVHGPEGWRFEKFISDRSDALWINEYESAGNRYIEEEARTADLSGTLYSPAFLTPEQRSVYEQAAKLMECCSYPEQLGFVPLEGDAGRVRIDGWEYQLYEQGYEELWKKFSAVFDDESLAKLEQSGVYRDWNGHLACKWFNQKWTDDRTQNMWLFAWDQFRIVSQDENEVEFMLISQYERLEEDGEWIRYTKEYPIRLVNTTSGWRVAELHNADNG